MKNIVNAYNKAEQEKAVEEKRPPVLIPHISAHTFRHTGCTRMAESGMNVKVLQYIMGHSNISVTMDVYSHAQEENITNEIDRLEQTQIAIVV